MHERAELAYPIDHQIRRLSAKTKAPNRLTSAVVRLRRPLRHLHQVRLAVAAVPTTIRLSGGVARMLHKAWRVARCEGFPGIKRRIVVAISIRGSDYKAWLEQYDKITNEDKALMKLSAAKMRSRPLFSILMPTCNTKEEWLRKAIESVIDQVYPDWELCITDDASAAPHVRRVLEEYANRDKRIRTQFRPTNGGIAEATNTALAMARGNFVALLDHDDELAPDALLCVAEEINDHSSAELIYSDEDKIEPGGRRAYPHFKPDWNYDLLLSYNFITHLAVYRTERVRAIGGFRSAFDGAQDYDLALRFITGLPASRIRHVPRILYHWRMHDQSTASNASAKGYAFSAATRAIEEHLSGQGIAAQVRQAPEGGIGHRVVYAIPADVPQVTLIIPTRNRVDILRSCIQSLLNTTDYPRFDVLIIDNGSSDPATLLYLESLSSSKIVRVLRDERAFNFSALNNRGAALANGEIIGLLNNDLEVTDPGWLREMVSHAVRPGVGVVGARLWFPDGTLQHGGVVLGVGGVAGHAHKYLRRGEPGYMSRAVLIQNFSAVTAACLLVRKSIFQEVGGVDEELPVAFNDVDFCLRVMTKGYRNVWTPYAELIHHESASRGLEDSPEKQERFLREHLLMRDRWGEPIRSDPAYNPNLTLEREDFSLAWPPRTRAVAARQLCA
jgi:O-antigen biosynthesis protein